MGYVFEELIRIGAEQSNEEAGEHFTPREVIKLMVNLLLSPEQDLRKSHVVKTIYDPACGTGGMLSVAERYIRDLNADADPHLFGQDWNDESWAICKADMLIKGEDADNIVLGDTFTRDGFDRDAEGKKRTFDYMLANPPFGVEWKQQQKYIEHEAESRSVTTVVSAPVLPRINDGSLLFLQHMLCQNARPERRRQPHRHRLQRLAAVHRRCRQRREQHPPVDHRKRLARGRGRTPRSALLQHRHFHLHLGAHQPQGARRKGKVQLIDARRFFVKMPKSLGNKRNKLGDPADRASEPDQIGDITRLFGNFTDGETRTFSEEDPITKQPVDRYGWSARSSTTPTSASTRSPSSARCDSTSRRPRSDRASGDRKRLHQARHQHQEEREGAARRDRAGKRRQDEIRKLLAPSPRRTARRSSRTARPSSPPCAMWIGPLACASPRPS
jgi:type I restriction enzyme M protein